MRPVRIGILGGLAAIIGVFALAVFIAFLAGAFSDTTVERRGQTAQQEQTQGSGSYRVANYDRFFNQCQAIVAKEGQIADLRATMSSDPTQRFYDEQNLRALTGSRRSDIASYNADAAKTGTVGQFRDSNLPSNIDPNGTTRCAA